MVETLVAAALQIDVFEFALLPFAALQFDVLDYDVYLADLDTAVLESADSGPAATEVVVFGTVELILVAFGLRPPMFQLAVFVHDCKTIVQYRYWCQVKVNHSGAEKSQPPLGVQKAPYESMHVVHLDS